MNPIALTSTYSRPMPLSNMQGRVNLPPPYRDPMR
jgi:hypothetical protein